MPKKSVLEINPFERMHYSLSGRTFRAIVLFSLIITVTAVSFGYYLYSSSVEREFRSRTWQMSKTAAMLLDRMENSRMVFITDSDSKESFCPPGCWDQLDSKDREALLNGRQYFLDKLFGTGPIPACLLHMEQCGFRCTAGTVIGTAEGYPVLVVFDTDMNQVMKVNRAFFLQFVALMALITLIVLALSIRHMNKITVGLINQLAAAAQAYIDDRTDGQRSSGHFNDLNIHTGDEIENLSLTIKEMKRDLAEYVENLIRITAEKERIGTELSLATRIQAAMLPHIFPPFPDRPEIDIYAVMDPAREVGGDFYHVCLISPLLKQGVLRQT